MRRPCSVRDDLGPARAKNVKVCHISNLYPPDVLGGAETVVARLAGGLQDAGHEAIVVSTAPRGRAGLDRIEGVRVLRLAPANIYWAGAARRRATIVKPLWHLLDLWNAVMYRRVRTVLLAEKPDVVHTHNLGGLSVAVWSATTAAGVPLVHTPHDHSLTCIRAVRMTRRGRLCERQCAPCAVRGRWLRQRSGAVDAIAAPSRFVVDRHLALGFFPRARTAIVPWGAPPVSVVATPSREDRPVKFLFIGGLEAHKGVGVVLEAFRRIPGTRATLDIAGAGAMADACRAAAGLDPRIRFHGFVTGPAKDRLFGSADVLLFPSLCWEVAGLVTLEAFAHGVPVLGSRTGGIPEFIEERQTGVLVEPGDVAALAAEVKRFAEDRGSVEAMRKACRTYAARFTWDRTVGELLAVYRAAVGQSKHPSPPRESSSRRV
jgi:glycosyltransferase involved in cell wall biosynthesis